MLKKTLLLLLFLTPFVILANNGSQIDSLASRLSASKDSARIPILTKLCWELRNSDPSKAIDHGLEAIALAEKFEDYESLAKLHGFVGVSYRILGNYSKSTDYYFLGLEIAKKHHLIEQEGFAYINIANLHIYQEYYKNAIDNLNRAFEIAKKINNKAMLSYVHLNLGRSKLLLKEYDSAFNEFNAALNIRKEIKFVAGLAVCYKYIGDIYFEKDDYVQAISNYNQSQNIVDINADRDLYANILVRKAELFLKTNEVNMASRYAYKSLEIAKEIGAKLTIRDALRIVPQVAKTKNRFDLATGNLESIIKYNDTLFNQQLAEKLFFLEYQLEKQKKETEIEILNREKTIRELQFIKARTFSIALLIVLLLLATLLLIVLVSLRHRKLKSLQLEKQNNEINSQRQSIEIKNKHLEEAYQVIEGYIGKITDSIKYAERIQKALLPSLSIASSYFPNIFCLYMPKDFVSGDFYWLSEKNESLYVAVADCTGHGVPGAFMSIIGMDLLNQAVNQLNIQEPKLILDYLNHELPLKLQKEENDLVLKDSMDIAVCRFDRDKAVVCFSGALIPLIICREKEIIEIKGSPVSLGISNKVYKKSFEQKVFPLEKNDWLYIFTDGFIDQFGGESGKKFHKSSFLKTLTQMNELPGGQQKNELEQVYSRWRGNNEQVDDVLVLGIKV